MPNKPYAATIMKWLRDNGHRLGGLTSQDARALLASVQVAALWSPYDESQKEIADAWGACVRQMQPHMRQFAFHAVAHVSEWNFRHVLWQQAFGTPLPVPCYRCTYE